jgi:hypothetical protein
MYFTKLDTIPTDIDFFEFKGAPGKSYPGLKPSMRISYYHFIGGLTGKNIALFNQHFPKLTDIIPDQILLVEITGSGKLPAHIDHGPRVVLNWYLHSNGSETSFYTKNEGAQGIKHTGETESNIFYFKDVTRVGEFVAKDNEVYLLNVGQVHSVDSPNEGVRRFVSLSWHNRTYEEILESIRLYKCNQ